MSLPGTKLAALLPDGAYAHLHDENGLVMLASGSGAPAATADTYGRGAIYLRNGGSSGQAVYSNDGTSASPSWVLVGATAAGEITLVRGSVLRGSAAGVAEAHDAKTSGKILVGDGTDIVSVAVSGDATLAANGAVTIANGAVTPAKLSNGAALAALIAAGGGANAAYPKDSTGALTLLASAGADRTVLLVVTVTEVFANGDGAQPTFKLGQTGTAAKFADTTAFTDKAAGSILTFAGTLSSGAALLVTAVAGTGTTETGALAVTVLVLPASA